MSAAAAPASLWILDDASMFSGGQRFALRLAAATGATIVCPAGTELERAARSQRTAVVAAAFPAATPSGAAGWPSGVAGLRRTLAAAPAGTVVLGNSGRASALALLATTRLRGAPRVVPIMHEPMSAGRAPARAFLRRFGGLLVVGDASAAAYRAALPGVHVVRVRNFLQAGDFARLREGARCPPRCDPPVLGVLARMAALKGLTELVDDLMAIPGAWSRADVGAGPQDAAYEATLRARVAALPGPARIRLLGHVGDPDAFFAAIDVLVVPSLGGEGQPTVILEALGRGVPVIARETVWEGSWAGLGIGRYATARQLAAALGDLPAQPVDVAELEARFGPGQLLGALADLP